MPTSPRAANIFAPSSMSDHLPERADSIGSLERKGRSQSGIRHSMMSWNASEGRVERPISLPVPVEDESKLGNLLDRRKSGNRLGALLSFEFERFKMFRFDKVLVASAGGMSQDEFHRQAALRHSLMKTDVLPWYVINPSGRFRISWDLFLMVCLIYLGLFIPVQIGFAWGPKGWWEIWEAFMDIMFVVDVFLNFLTAYRDANDDLEFRLNRIAYSYLRGYLAIDVVSSIPFDHVLLLFDSGAPEGLSGTQGTKSLKAGRLLKISRVLKLAKISRLLRVGKISKSLADELDLVGRTPFVLLRITTVTFLVAHIIACLWSFVARFSGEEEFYSSSWVSAYGGGLVDAPISKQYLVAMYWAITTLTTVGYGDLSPVNNIEIAYAAFAMIVGGFFYSYIIASLAAILTSADTHARVLNEKIDATISYMRQRNFPRRLFRRVRAYYQHYYERKTALDEEAILANLSTQLRVDVASFLAQGIFSGTHLFEGLDQQLLTKLLSLLQPLKCATGETVFECGSTGKDFHIIVTGLVALYVPDFWDVVEKTLSEENLKKKAEIKKVKSKAISSRIRTKMKNMPWKWFSSCSQSGIAVSPMAPDGEDAESKADLNPDRAMPIYQMDEGFLFGEFTALDILPKRCFTAVAEENTELYYLSQESFINHFAAEQDMLLDVHVSALAHLRWLEQQLGVDFKDMANKRAFLERINKDLTPKNSFGKRSDISGTRRSTASSYSGSGRASMSNPGELNLQDLNQELNQRVGLQRATSKQHISIAQCADASMIFKSKSLKCYTEATIAEGTNSTVEAPTHLSGNVTRNNIAGAVPAGIFEPFTATPAAAAALVPGREHAATSSSTGGTLADLAEAMNRMAADQQNILKQQNILMQGLKTVHNVQASILTKLENLEGPRPIVHSTMKNRRISKRDISKISHRPFRKSVSERVLSKNARKASILARTSFIAGIEMTKGMSPLDSSVAYPTSPTSSVKYKRTRRASQHDRVLEGLILDAKKLIT